MKNIITKNIASFSLTKPEQSGRIESLDFLRGIAAFAVMFFHYTAESSIHLSDENPLRLIGIYGHHGVEIFFVVSGFVIPLSMKMAGYKINLIGKFLLKRTIRIEVPYLTLIIAEIILIYIISLTPFKNGPSERLNTYSILLHISYLNGVLDKPWLIPVFWTLAIEFQFYLLIALLFPLLVGRSKGWSMLTIVTIVMLSFLLPQPYLFFHYSLFFLLGIVAFQFTFDMINKKEFLLILVGVFILLYFQFGVISLSIAVMSITFILFFRINWRWSAFLGTLSYSTYLIHVPLGGRLLALTQLFVHSEWIKSMLILMFCVITIGGAWLFYVYVERPSLLLSKRVHYKERE